MRGCVCSLCVVLKQLEQCPYGCGWLVAFSSWLLFAFLGALLLFALPLLPSHGDCLLFTARTQYHDVHSLLCMQRPRTFPAQKPLVLQYSSTLVWQIRKIRLRSSSEGQKNLHLHATQEITRSSLGLPPFSPPSLVFDNALGCFLFSDPLFAT